jgi:hypothetical protein
VSDAPAPAWSDVQATRLRQRALAVRRPADRTVLVLALIGAVATDIALRAGLDGLAGALLVAVVAGCLLASRRVTNPQAMVLAAAAVIFGAFLAVRSSPWLVPFDVLAAAGLLVLAASLADKGSLFDLTVPAAFVRGVDAMGHGLLGPAYLAGAVPKERRGGTTAATLRGLAVAVPLLLVLGLLLASADAVFADFLDFLDSENLLQHAVLLVLGTWGMAGLVRVASAAPPPSLPRTDWRLGQLEVTIVLASLIGLFGMFAAAQLVALSKGGRHVIETAGLTYAEYARTGFFQLLAVAAITLVTLLGLRAVARVDTAAARRRFLVLALIVVALTLVIVGVALSRLSLYERAFGLTMLRLYSQVFALWIGAVFVMLAVDLVVSARRDGGPGRSWLPGAAAVAGLVALLVLNVANPEAVAVRHNVDFAERTGKVDALYLSELSDDAVPALASALPRLDPVASHQLLDHLCEPYGRAEDGLLDWSVGKTRAGEARQSVCAD